MARVLERKHWHESITRERVAEMVEREATTLDNPGACLICGEEAMGVEPDAENYPCEARGAEQVFGAETLFIMLI
jgi:hypothetical protein